MKKQTNLLGKLLFNTASRVAPSLVIAFALTLLTAEPMHAQFQVLHYFTDGADGANPIGGVTVGGSGTLYGTTTQGGIFPCGGFGCGVVFKLAQHGTFWVSNPLYEFAGFAGGRTDGAYPYAGVVDLNGVLYGTTGAGGITDNGTVFQLRPPPSICRSATCYWNETALYSFAGSPNDGGGPAYGNVTFNAGNIYGSTFAGGLFNCGTVWELIRTGGDWTESVLYNFTGGTDGCNPYSGVVFDRAGNLYGNTYRGGGSGNAGSIYELMSGTWTENTLVDLDPLTTGANPVNTLVIDLSSGNLYGTAFGGGPNGDGTVYELSPSDGGWNFSLVYAFSFCAPISMTLGPDGNLYGGCYEGGANRDSWVFEMPPNCNQTCTPGDLHDFDGRDGAIPYGPVAFDTNGNLYGTTLVGGNSNLECDLGSGLGCGVVWEIAGVGARH